MFLMFFVADIGAFMAGFLCDFYISKQEKTGANDKCEAYHSDRFCHSTPRASWAAIMQKYFSTFAWRGSTSSEFFVGCSFCFFPVTAYYKGNIFFISFLPKKNKSPNKRFVRALTSRSVIINFQVFPHTFSFPEAHHHLR